MVVGAKVATVTAEPLATGGRQAVLSVCRTDGNQPPSHYWVGETAPYETTWVYAPERFVGSTQGTAWPLHLVLLWRIPLGEQGPTRLAAPRQMPTSAQVGATLGFRYESSSWPYFDPAGTRLGLDPHDRREPPNPLSAMSPLGAGHIAVVGLGVSHAYLWSLDVTLRRESSAVPSPGRWKLFDRVIWPNDQPFRVLPSARRWWFLTKDGVVWSVPKAGERGRSVERAWEPAGKTVLASLIDSDLDRSFVFGDGWYLDLGDELKTVTEPADKPWPRPAADALVVEKLRVQRTWVDLAAR
jgi:hypothetical protein